MINYLLLLTEPARQTSLPKKIKIKYVSISIMNDKIIDQKDI